MKKYVVENDVSITQIKRLVYEINKFHTFYITQ